MKQWRTCLITKETSILEAANNINESGKQIALVVDEKEHLLGTITDGDIRRAIIKQIDLQSSVEVIMTKNPTIVTEHQSITEVHRLMSSRNLHHIPVVDRNGKVCGLKGFSDSIIPKKKKNAVVLMAGGLGTRLWPMTKTCPKPMLKIGSKPILETILTNFIEYGFERFFISVNYKMELIEEYFGDGTDFGVEIAYLREDKKMGTAGSLSLLSQKEEHPLIVMNGDILTKIDYDALLDYHTEEDAIATMAVREYVSQIPYGVIECDGNTIQSIKEKPEKRFLINAGIYVLNPEVIALIKEKEIRDMPMVFHNLIESKQKTSAFPVKEYWLDIGRIADFERAQNEYIDVFGE